MEHRHDYRNEYVLNKRQNNLNLDENDNLDHEIIDLTKNTLKREVEAVNVPIDIPIYLQSSTRRNSREYQQDTKFVSLEPNFNKPRIVSTSFVTPVTISKNLSNLPKNSAFIKENSDENDKKPRFIYYYDDESFGGY